MASSFNIFRRNQKLMLAIVTLMAMFAFVFLDPLMKYIGQYQAPANPIVVETKYGDLKRSDIENLKSSRSLVENFLKMLAQSTVKKLMDQGLIDVRSPGLQEFYVQQLQNGYIGQVMRSPRPTHPQEVVDTMLLTRKAEAMNVIVSDEAINATLKDLTRNSVPAADIARIIRNLRSSERQLFDALRSELSATTVTQNFVASVRAMPPAEMWDYYRRLNQKATIEAVAVPVAEFTDRVPDPDDAELKKFFDEYKERLAFPGSPEPGFRLPRRQKFQYFKAEYDLFRETAEVTEDEIKKYYEENKQSFRKLALPEEEPKTEEKDKPAVENPEPSPEATEKSAEDAGKSNETTPAEKEPAKEAGDKKPATPAPNADGAVNPPRGRSGARILLVADEKPAPTTTPEEPTDNKEATENKTDDQPAAEEKPTEEGKPAEETKPVEPQYEPLEDVREQIIRTLKDQKARKKINEAVENLMGQVSAYSDALTTYDFQKKDDPTAKAPKEPNFVELAKQHHLEFAESKLGSYFDFNSSTGLGSSRYGDMPYADMVFRQTTSNYSPMVSEDTDGNIYLSWKVDDVAEKVPTFEEVRADVLKTWKLIKAREFARKQAESYAAEATGAKKSLSEVFSGEKAPKVIKAGPFTWMTLGTTADNPAGRVPMMSEVVGIESPGTQFMETTFGLEKGGVGVAENGPKDTYYVIQATDFEPPVKELEEDFAREDIRSYIGAAAGEQQKLMQDWHASLERDADVKWLQPASTIE